MRPSKPSIKLMKFIMAVIKITIGIKRITTLESIIKSENNLLKQIKLIDVNT